MKLRAKLVLSFLGLAVVPLAAITLYSYNSSLRALHKTAEQESSAMASDMGSRMESVSKEQPAVLHVALAPPPVPLGAVDQGRRSLLVTTIKVVGQPYAPPRPARDTSPR